MWPLRTAVGRGPAARLFRRRSPGLPTQSASPLCAGGASAGRGSPARRAPRSTTRAARSSPARSRWRARSSRTSGRGTARSRRRVLDRAHRQNVPAFTASPGRSPGPDTTPFLILRRPDTVRDSFDTDWARPAARRLVCCPQQAAGLDGRRARVGCRIAPRMASAGLSASDFRLVVVGHGYARLLRVLYRYCVEPRPSR